MRILLVGGGTGGPAIPLLAVQQHMKKNHPKAEFLFVGTFNGPELTFAKKYAVPFVSIPAGKLRRYFSVKNFFSPFLVLAGFFKSLSIIYKFKPDLVFAAGGFVSVPAIMAAWIMRKKILIHQQDLQPTLSNQLVAPLADKITVTFEKSLKDFRSGSGMFWDNRVTEKAQWTGNPVREDILEAKNKNPADIKKKMGLKEDLPVMLITGGATGAQSLNQILLEALPELVKFIQVIHSTGKGKSINFIHPNYHPYELLDNMDEAYAVSDIVISRAGLSSISELCALSKVSIIIPLPDSHQLHNAEILEEKNAAVVLDQQELSGADLVQLIRKLMYNGSWQNELKENISNIIPQGATEKISNIILQLCKQK